MRKTEKPGVYSKKRTDRSRFRSRQPRAACRRTEGLCIRKRKRFHPESCSPGPALAGRSAQQRAPVYSRTGQKQTDKALLHLPHRPAVSQQKHLIPLQRFAADASKAAGRRIRLPAAATKSFPIRRTALGLSAAKGKRKLPAKPQAGRRPEIQSGEGREAVVYSSSVRPAC